MTDGPGRSGDEVLRRPRAGILVPPENPVVEPELSSLLGGTADCFSARLPVRQADLATRLHAYVEGMPETLASYGTLRLDAVLVACTGSSYPLGPDGDAALCARLSQMCQAPVATAATAVLAALDALGRPPVVLLSPYPRWLSEQAGAFLAAAGVTMEALIELDPAGRGIYRLTPGEIVAKALEIADPPVPSGDAGESGPRAPSPVLLFTGTGAPTLAALEALAALGRLALSSNLCGAWWLARCLSLDPESAPGPRRAALHPALQSLIGRCASGSPAAAG